MSKFASFNKIWAGEQKQSFMDSLKEALRGKEPIRYRIAVALYKLKSTINRLEVFLNKLEARDKMLFERVVEAHIAKDKARAAMYATEVAEIRKMVKTILATQIALEQVAIRLETIQVFGDVASSVIPVVGVVRQLRNVIRGIMPELGLELAEVEELLNGLVIEAGEFTGSPAGHGVVTGEAKRILEEAAIIAEQRMKEKFPDLPVFAKAGEAEETKS